MIFEMAWRNVWRQPRRSILSAIAIMLTSGLLIFLPALQWGSYQAMIYASIGILDGGAQIQRSEYLDTPTMRTSFKPNSELIQNLKSIFPEYSLAKRANTFALISSDERSFGVQIVGVEVDKEDQISSIPRNIKQGRYLNSTTADTGAPGEIILGETLAKNLRIKTGDRVTLLGSGRDGSLAADSLQLVGIFATGLKALDRQLAQIQLSRFDSTFSMAGQIHGWVLIDPQHDLFARYPKSLHKALLPHDLTLRSWREMQPALLNAILLDISSAITMYVVLILVIVFSLLNSALMSVLERTREFGMMMALGVKSGLLAKIVWVESLIIMAMGIIAGIVVAALVTIYYEIVGITFSGAEVVFEEFGLDSTIYPDLNLFTLLSGPIVIALCLAFAGLYPTIRIQQLHIVTAMRAV